MVKAASGAVTVRALMLKLRGLGAIVVFCLRLDCALSKENPSSAARREFVRSLKKLWRKLRKLWSKEGTGLEVKAGAKYNLRQSVSIKGQ